MGMALPTDGQSLPTRWAVVAADPRVVNSLTAECRCHRYPCCAGLCTEDGLRIAHRQYARRLQAVARRVVVDPHLAEEAVQEAFTRAWRACATFDPAEGPLYPWLVTITRNVAIDLVKARTRRPPLAGSPTNVDAQTPVGTHEELLLLRDELRMALGSLRSEHRHAVVETILRDRAHTDVAQELGIPAGTVRSRAHYALRRLRVALETSRAAEGFPA